MGVVPPNCKHLLQWLGETGYDWDVGIATTPVVCQDCGAKLPDLVSPIVSRDLYISNKQGTIQGGTVQFRRGKRWQWKGYHVEQAAGMSKLR